MTKQLTDSRAFGLSAARTRTMMHMFRLNRLSVSLRHLFCAITGVALLLAVIAWKVQEVRDELVAEKHFNDLGGWVLHGWSFERNESPLPNWIERTVGNEYLCPVRSVIIDGSTLDTYDWLPLKSFRHLLLLQLSGASFGDAEFSLVRCKRNLRALALDNTSVTDNGVAMLVVCSRLESLSLSGTAISDEGLDVIKHIKSLQRVNVKGTYVSDAGVRRFHAQRPDIELLVSE